jgi:hypothetical protein
MRGPQDSGPKTLAAKFYWKGHELETENTRESPLRKRKKKKKSFYAKAKLYIVYYAWLIACGMLYLDLNPGHGPGNYISIR